MFFYFIGIIIPDENIKVKFGFELSGIVSILGYEISCVIKLTSDEIDIDIRMSPMEFAGGVAKMYRSETDTKNGPKFKIKISKTELLVKADGMVCLLGIQAQAKILITNKEFRLDMKANLFDLLEGTILIQAGAEKNMGSANFKVGISLVILFKF